MYKNERAYEKRREITDKKILSNGWNDSSYCNMHRPIMQVFNYTL